MSSTTVSLQPSRKERKQYFGVIFDDYTPAVEGQMLRDCLALQRTAQNKNAELVIVCESDKPDRLLQALGIRRVPTPSLTKAWVMYKTKEMWMPEPEDANVVVPRDLYQPIKKNKLRVLDDDHTNGYYLPPQGRLSPDTVSLLRPSPNGYTFVEPLLVLNWS
jgi:hypothetical protein